MRDGTEPAGPLPFRGSAWLRLRGPTLRWQPPDAIADQPRPDVAHGLRCRLGHDALVGVGCLKPLAAIGLSDYPHLDLSRRIRAIRK